MQKHFIHREITEFSAGLKLFLGEMGSCCIRTSFIQRWSEEVMNMSLAESVERCGSSIFLFSERPPFWHETEYVNSGLTQRWSESHTTLPAVPRVFLGGFCDCVSFVSLNKIIAAPGHGNSHVLPLLE